jgi:hypothetical protein
MPKGKHPGRFGDARRAHSVDARCPQRRRYCSRCGASSAVASVSALKQELQGWDGRAAPISSSTSVGPQTIRTSWGGSRLRLLDDPLELAQLAAQGAPPPVPRLAESGIELGAKRLVAVNDGYHGGRFVRRSMTGYLQQDGWTEAGCPLL